VAQRGWREEVYALEGKREGLKDVIKERIGGDESHKKRKGRNEKNSRQS
jgi:hypothetical protein